MAGVAVAALLVLPLPVMAQVDVPRRQAPIGKVDPKSKPAAPASGSMAPDTGNNNGATPALLPSRRIDVLNLRDDLVVAPAPLPVGAEPLATDGVVCLAGCDTAPGAVVYSNRAMPSLASLSAPKPVALQPVALLNDQAPPATASPLTCLAGCYEPTPARTVASLRAQFAKGNAQNTARSRRTAKAKVIAHPTAAVPPVAPTLRSSIAVEERAVSVRRTAKHGRSLRATAKRHRIYGKVAAPSAAHSAAPREQAPAPKALPTPVMSAVPAERPVPVATAKATVAKTEVAVRKKSPPLATVSNDWFNKINRERNNAPPTQAQD